MFRRTIERGQKSSCCYVKRTKPWKRARRASASPFCCFPPFFPRFPASPVPVSFPLHSNRYASFSTFFNHIELRIDAYQIFGKTIKNIFIFFLVFKSLGNVADLNLDAFKPSRLVIRPRYLDLPSSDLYSIRL